MKPASEWIAQRFRTSGKSVSQTKSHTPQMWSIVSPTSFKHTFTDARMCAISSDWVLCSHNSARCVRISICSLYTVTNGGFDRIFWIRSGIYLKWSTSIEQKITRFEYQRRLSTKTRSIRPWWMVISCMNPTSTTTSGTDEVRSIPLLPISISFAPFVPIVVISANLVLGFQKVTSDIWQLSDEISCARLRLWKTSCVRGWRL